MISFIVWTTYFILLSGMNFWEICSFVLLEILRLIMLTIVLDFRTNIFVFFYPISLDIFFGILLANLLYPNRNVLLFKQYNDDHFKEIRTDYCIRIILFTFSSTMY